MNPRFTNQVVVVTGAAQGIGRRVAEAFAAEGAQVWGIDRSPIVEELEGLTGVAHAPQTRLADLEQASEATAAMDAIAAAAGRIDVLVNNVGGTIWAKPYEHYRSEEIQAEIQRSLFPTLWCCHAVLPHMLQAEKGAIVNVSSVATRSLHRVPYAAAKGGINALTASLAFETAQRGIRVNATAPGGTEAPTRRVPRNEQPLSGQEQEWYQAIVDQTIDTSLMKRYGTLNEQVGAILFLASEHASYITGITLPVGGGDLG